MRACWYTLSILGVILGIAGAASAVPVTCGQGGPQNVLAAGFECTIGGLTFGTFSVTNAGLTPIDGFVLVSADVVGGDVFLNFNPNLVASSNTADIWLYFTETGLINGIDLSVGGSNSAITERACSTPIDVNGGNNCTGGLANQLGQLVNFSGASNVATLFDGQSASQVYIFKDIITRAPGELTAFSQSFHLSEVPEPATLFLVGVGLSTLGARVRFRRRPWSMQPR